MVIVPYLLLALFGRVPFGCSHIIHPLLLEKKAKIALEMFVRMSTTVHSYGFAIISFCDRFRLTLVKQKDNRSRTSSKRIDIVLDMRLPYIFDLPCVLFAFLSLTVPKIARRVSSWRCG
jgi:hypothetical protein